MWYLGQEDHQGPWVSCLKVTGFKVWVTYPIFSDWHFTTGTSYLCVWLGRKCWLGQAPMHIIKHISNKVHTATNDPTQLGFKDDCYQLHESFICKVIMQT